MLFEIKFNKIWRILLLSVVTLYNISLLFLLCCISNTIFLEFALKLSTWKASLTISNKLTFYSIFNSKTLFLIFARVSKSSVKFDMTLAEDTLFEM
jgi:hypothetical protein